MNFCFHDFQPWSQPIATYNGGYKQQWRSCKKCNLAMFRTLSYDQQSQIQSVLAALNENSTPAPSGANAACEADKS